MRLVLGPQPVFCFQSGEALEDLRVFEGIAAINGSLVRVRAGLPLLADFAFVRFKFFQQTLRFLAGDQ